MTTIECNTANDAWLRAAEALLFGQDTKEQPSRAGDTKELLRVTFYIKNPLQRWVVSRTPALNPAFAIAETFWVLSGLNDSRFLNFWNPQLPNFAGKCNSYHGAYGYRLRRHFDFDQLESAYQILRQNPDSRQVVLQIWDATKDLPWKTGRPKSKDIPCNLLSLLKVRDERLEWTQIVRSNDIFLGVPYDFAQFMIFQEIFAGWLGLEVGTYFHLSDSLHVYKQDLSKFVLVNNIAEATNTDDLRLPWSESKLVIPEVTRSIHLLSQKHCSEQQIESIADHNGIPEAYRNLLRIVAAESARKRKWSALARITADKCTNPALHQLWSRWLDRLKGSSRDLLPKQQSRVSASNVRL